MDQPITLKTWVQMMRPGFLLITAVACGLGTAMAHADGVVVQGEGNSTFPDFPLRRLTRKGITLKSARGHSYRAVELALHALASKRFPLELMTTHRFGLNEVDLAIKSVGGEGAPGAIHVSVMPWT